MDRGGQVEVVGDDIGGREAVVPLQQSTAAKLVGIDGQLHPHRRAADDLPDVLPQQAIDLVATFAATIAQIRRPRPRSRSDSSRRATVLTGLPRSAHALRSRRSCTGSRCPRIQQLLHRRRSPYRLPQGEVDRVPLRLQPVLTHHARQPSSMSMFVRVIHRTYTRATHGVKRGRRRWSARPPAATARPAGCSGADHDDRRPAHGHVSIDDRCSPAGGRRRLVQVRRRRRSRPWRRCPFPILVPRPLSRRPRAAGSRRRRCRSWPGCRSWSPCRSVTSYQTSPPARWYVRSGPALASTSGRRANSPPGPSC